jgi:hypothetical protein
MKKTLLILLLGILVAADLRSAVIEANSRNFTSEPTQRRRLTLTLIEAGPVVAGPWLIAGDSESQFTATNGVAYFSNVLSGAYRLDIAGSPGRSFPITVPDTNGVLSAAALVNTTNLNTDFYTATQVDALIAAGAGSAFAAADTVVSNGLSARLLATNTALVDRITAATNGITGGTSGALTNNDTRTVTLTNVAFGNTNGSQVLLTNASQYVINPSGGTGLAAGRLGSGYLWSTTAGDAIMSLATGSVSIYTNAVFGSTMTGNGIGLTNISGTNLIAGSINSNKLDGATLALLGSGGGSGLTEAQVVASMATNNAASLVDADEYFGTYYIWNQEKMYISKGTLKSQRFIAGPVSSPAASTFSDPVPWYHSGNYYVAHTLIQFSGPTNKFAIIKSDGDLNKWTTLHYFDCSSASNSLGASIKTVWSPRYFKDGDGSVYLTISLGTNTGASTGIRQFITRAIDNTFTNWTSLVMLTNSLDITPITTGAYTGGIVKSNSQYQCWVMRAGGGLEVHLASNIYGPWTAWKTNNWHGWGTTYEQAEPYRKADGSWVVILSNGGEFRQYYTTTTNDDFTAFTTPVAMANSMSTMNGGMHPVPARDLPGSTVYHFANGYNTTTGQRFYQGSNGVAAAANANYSSYIKGGTDAWLALNGSASTGIAFDPENAGLTDFYIAGRYGSVAATAIKIPKGTQNFYVYGDIMSGRVGNTNAPATFGANGVLTNTTATGTGSVVLSNAPTLYNLTALGTQNASTIIVTNFYTGITNATLLLTDANGKLTNAVANKWRYSQVPIDALAWGSGNLAASTGMTYSKVAWSAGGALNGASDYLYTDLGSREFGLATRLPSTVTQAIATVTMYAITNDSYTLTYYTAPYVETNAYTAGGTATQSITNAQGLFYDVSWTNSWSGAALNQPKEVRAFWGANYTTAAGGYRVVTGFKVAVKHSTDP